MYRDGDYDKNEDRKSTASFPEGLCENYRYVPNMSEVVRRTSSLDDVSRFKRYFSLVQANCGKSFQWRHYAGILHDGFRHFKTPRPPKRVQSTPRSEVSVYFTASEGAVITPDLKATSKRNFRKLGLGNGRVSRDATPSSSNSSVTVRSHIWKVCEETKNLARDIRLKVDKITMFQPKGRSYETRSKKHLVRTIGDTPSKHRSSQSEDDASSGSCLSNGAGDIARRRRPGTSGIQRSKK